MEFSTKNFRFSIRTLLDPEIFFIFLFVLAGLAFLVADARILPVSDATLSKYRPDLTLHFLFGYAVNKFWRLTYMARGTLKNVVIDFYLSAIVHFGKEIFDVIRRNTLLAFDPLDIAAALLGLVAEDVKYALSKKHPRMSRLIRR